MTFKNGQEMLDQIVNKSDLYNEELGIYVFVYNDTDGICYYNIMPNEFYALKKRANEINDVISGLLGVGGSIIMGPTDEDYEEGDYNNLGWCNENYYGDWRVIDWPK